MIADLANRATPLGFLSRLLPPPVASYDTFSSASPHELPTVERETIRRAVPARRREFATGRECARRALSALGLPAAAIPAGPDRDPCWPPGVVGSITHSAGYCAAALAPADRVYAIGIDAEVAEPLPADILPIVATAAEQRHLDDLRRSTPDVPWSRLLFAAKEAVYKAWFPRSRRWLDFDDVRVRFLAGDSTFIASVPGLPAPQGPPLPAVAGRWICTARLVLTAVVVGCPAGVGAAVEAERGSATATWGLGAPEPAR